MISSPSEFTALTNKLYFNYGGQGTLPKSALTAIIEGYNYIQSHGPFGLNTNIWVNKVAQSLREAIATELGVNWSTITLTEDVTVGCNIPLWGIEWQVDDRILISDCEHPGVMAIVQEIERRYGVEVVTFPLRDQINQEQVINSIKDYLTPQVKLILCSHVLWNTGAIVPLEAIVNLVRNYPSNHRIYLLIDGAQSVGLLPLNLAEIDIDFYAFTGHKWWCGPEGVGGLYINPHTRINPTFIGWRGLDYSKVDLPLQNDGRRYEIATSAYPLYQGLNAAINYHYQWGDQRSRYQKILELADYLWLELNQILGVNCIAKKAPESGLVSFQLGNGKHSQLVAYLEENNCYLRTIVDPDCVRACVHYFTTFAEIDRLIELIKNF